SLCRQPPASLNSVSLLLTSTSIDRSEHRVFLVLCCNFPHEKSELIVVIEVRLRLVFFYSCGITVTPGAPNSKGVFPIVYLNACQPITEITGLAHVIDVLTKLQQDFFDAPIHPLLDFLPAFHIERDTTQSHICDDWH